MEEGVKGGKDRMVVEEWRSEDPGERGVFFSWYIS